MLLPEHLSSKVIHDAHRLKIFPLACQHLKMISKCPSMIYSVLIIWCLPTFLASFLTRPLTSPHWALPFHDTQLLAVYEFAWELPAGKFHRQRSLAGCRSQSLRHNWVRACSHTHTHTDCYILCIYFTKEQKKNQKNWDANYILSDYFFIEFILSWKKFKISYIYVTLYVT